MPSYNYNVRNGRKINALCLLVAHALLEMRVLKWKYFHKCISLLCSFQPSRGLLGQMKFCKNRTISSETEFVLKQRLNNQIVHLE